MNSTVIVAIISFLGTLVGTLGGIITSSKLTEYRISQLEKKVEGQATAISRIPVLEEKINNLSPLPPKSRPEHPNFRMSNQ